MACLSPLAAVAPPLGCISRIVDSGCGKKVFKHCIFQRGRAFTRCGALDSVPSCPPTSASSCSKAR